MQNITGIETKNRRQGINSKTITQFLKSEKLIGHNI